uniref:Uncharacterized protein n=1 Tax=Triticum urartu TaxID=4572 RepID=A0A8R7QI58_TRIUA
GGAEDARLAEQLQDVPEVGDPGRVHLRVGCDVGQGGGAAAAVDGVGDAEVHGALERHGLDVAEHVVLELRKSYEQLLRAHFRQELKRHLATL